MGWKLHHVNIPAINLRETADFYRHILGMQDRAMPVKREDRGEFAFDSENLAWFEDGHSQLHVYRPSPTMARDNNFFINPVVNGHIAIQVDDIDEVKRRLDAQGTYYADPGHWAMQDYYQIYVHDPAMNVVEINQPMK